MKPLRDLSFILLSGVLSVAAFAQQSAPAARRKPARPAARAAGPVTEAAPETPAPVTPESPAYLTGEAEVTAQGNRNPIIRLGLARNGATVVEFPAADFFFAVHPGSENIVTVEESPTLATDHYLVFRAGPDFAAPLPETTRRAEPQAAVSVQMQSGLFVTFLFYPAPDVGQMAHRCVVRYSRAEVVAARKAAGLAVNLDEVAANTEPTPMARSFSVKPPAAVVATPAVNGVTAMPAEAGPSWAVELTTTPAPRRKKQTAAPVPAAQDALRAALAAPNQFAGWSSPAHGLALSVLPPVELNGKQWLTVVAVRNSTAQGLRLIASPTLETATLDERGNAALTQPLAVLHTATTSPGGAVPAGATIYYALVFDAPVLGARQRLRVTASHALAADEPVTALIPQ